MNPDQMYTMFRHDKLPKYLIEQRSDGFHLHRCIEGEDIDGYRESDLIVFNGERYLSDIVTPHGSIVEAQKLVESYWKAIQQLFESFG